VEQEYESKLTEVQQSIDAARKRREARSNAEDAMQVLSLLALLVQKVQILTQTRVHAGGRAVPRSSRA
jgi:hypothetical protein